MDVYKSSNLRKGDTVIDIGASIGEFSVLASRIVGNNGKVISIEPSPDDFNTLLKNLKTNLCNNVMPLNLVISHKPEKIKLEFKGKTFESNADSLANILRTLNIDPERIRFMKMDIEGWSVLPYHQASKSLKTSASWQLKSMADTLLN